MSHLAILGASGHGKVIADTASLNPAWERISFFDDAWLDIEKDFPWSVIGDTDELLVSLDRFAGVSIGIGNNTIRQQKHTLLASHFADFAIIIHPQAYVSPYAKIGDGTVIFANSVVNIHATLGLSCIVNTGATIDHDCRVGDYAHVSPGANLGGEVKIGQCSWVGIGSSVRQCITVGSSVVIGAGSVVVSNISDKQIVVGAPAKPLQAFAQ